MAQLKDTIVSGNLRVTDTILTDTIQADTIKARTGSSSTTCGPGTNGQVLKSNGTNAYWGDSTAAPGTLNTTATTAQSTSSSEALSGNITLHKIAKTGTYSDLIGKPSIPAAPGVLNTNNADAQSVNASESFSGTIKLHKVSKTGNYEDLLNKPTIPTDSKVTQTATTTSSAYELLFSETADNTTRTEGARKTSTLTYNPSTKAMSTGGAVNGLTLSAQTTGFKISGGTTSKTLTVGADYTLGAACAKGVTDNSSATAVTSSDTNLITGRTLYYAGYVKSSGVTSITLTSGTGITVSDSGTAITGTGSRTISLNVSGAKTALGLGTMAYEAKADYVLLATAQTISAKHTFSNGILLNTASS